jgi:hypothetical protein
MARQVLPSVIVAGATSALAVIINVATDLRHSWWAWAGVVGLTGVTGFLSYWTRRSPDVDKPEPARGSTINTISGDVSGNVVQADRIDGDVRF